MSYRECGSPGCDNYSITNDPHPPRCFMHLHYESEREPVEKKPVNHGGEEMAKKKKAMKSKGCGYPECTGKPFSRGLCSSHAHDPKVREKYALPKKIGGGGKPKVVKPKRIVSVSKKRRAKRVPAGDPGGDNTLIFEAAKHLLPIPDGPTVDIEATGSVSDKIDEVKNNLTLLGEHVAKELDRISKMLG